MNKNQKYVLGLGILLITVALIYWYSQGSEVLTKTQILVDKTTELDKMLGVKNEQWVNKFVFGLLPSGMSSIMEMLSVVSVTGLIVLITGILDYLLRNKKKETI